MYLFPPIARSVEKVNACLMFVTLRKKPLSLSRCVKCPTLPSYWDRVGLGVRLEAQRAPSASRASLVRQWCSFGLRPMPIRPPPTNQRSDSSPYDRSMRGADESVWVSSRQSKDRFNIA